MLLLACTHGVLVRGGEKAGDGPVYKMAPAVEVVNAFTEVPCGTCKVSRRRMGCSKQENKRGVARKWERNGRVACVL